MSCTLVSTARALAAGALLLAWGCSDGTPDRRPLPPGPAVPFQVAMPATLTAGQPGYLASVPDLGLSLQWRIAATTLVLPEADVFGQAPAGMAFPAGAQVLQVGAAAQLLQGSGGGSVLSYSVAPPLPPGLALDPAGPPSVWACPARDLPRPSTGPASTLARTTPRAACGGWPSQPTAAFPCPA